MDSIVERKLLRERIEVDFEMDEERYEDGDKDEAVDLGEDLPALFNRFMNGSCPGRRP